MIVLIAYRQQTTKNIIINTHTHRNNKNVNETRQGKLTSVVAWGVVSVVGSVAGWVEGWATEWVAV